MATAQSTTKDAQRFFYKHAGYATPPGRRECARQLADAESQAHALGLTFTWEPDPDSEPCYETCPHRDEEHTHEILGCVARDRSGTVLASLWAIFDPSRDYGRVVEAELASEALHSVGYSPTFPK